MYLLYCHIRTFLVHCRSIMQFGLHDILILKAGNKQQVFVSINSVAQYAFTAGCKQYLSLLYLQAIVWKDTLYKHRFYQTVFIHGEDTCAHANARGCTCSYTHCDSDSNIPRRDLTHTHSVAHTCTRLVFTQVVPHLPQPLNLRRELCSKGGLESQ